MAHIPVRQGHYPDAYGSKDDTRVEDITQLDPAFTIRAKEHVNYLDKKVSEEDIDDAEYNARPPSETPRFEPYKQYFQFTAPIGVITQQNIPFKAQSLRVDNFTNQWVFIAQLRIFIPPDWFGAIFSTTGMSAFTIDFLAPNGLVQAAPTANTIVNLIAHSERLIDVAGVKRL